MVCENYSPPDGFNHKDLHLLLEKIGSPSGADDLGNSDAIFFGLILFVSQLSVFSKV